MRHLIPAIVLALASCHPAFAQTTPLERVEKARVEVDAVENAADRAVYACTRNQRDKCILEARNAANGASRALYAIDRAIEVLEHDGHDMPDPPEPQPLTVDDIVPIPSDFDLADYTWRVPVPGTAAPDNVGAFRFVCNASHLAHDDPIVFPGQKGRSHLHLFFGNDAADANSTYESLRTSGGSTCQGDVLNRSAYWMPALLSAPDSGLAVVPDFIGNYYKRRPSSDPECTRAPHKGCVGIPAGLRAIFGTNYVQGHTQSPHVRFDCASGFSAPTLAEIVERCRTASLIYARIEAPDCWNGRDLDSANHQDHLAYMFYDGTRPAARCPETHPYVIPQLSLIAAFAVLPGDTPETWIFSSDLMAGRPAGSTFHADYMEAWEPEARLAWERNCLDGFLSCAGGDLGDGRLMKAPAGFSFAQRPHLVAVPELIMKEK